MVRSPATTFAETLKRARGLLTLHEEVHGRRGRPFQHTSDLVRAVVVLGVSALDAYVHQKVVSGLGRPLFGAPPLALRERVESLAKAEPGILLKLVLAPAPDAALADELAGRFYKETMQHPGSIQAGFALIGYPDIWGRVASQLPLTESEIRSELAEYVNRRHWIVHEADLDPTRGRRRTRPITKTYAETCLDFLESLVNAMEVATGTRPP